MRRFWTMLAHYHGGIWNASELARSMGIDSNTVRAYLDALTGTFMVRQLQPWFTNLGKRQVKSPKIYLRDSGILHSFLAIPDHETLTAHPKVGASWEGFILEQLCDLLQLVEPYFWAIHQGAELDLFFVRNGKNYGVEIEYSKAPKVTKSMRIALQDMELEHLWVIHPGSRQYPMEEKISSWPAANLQVLAEAVL